MTKNEQIDGIFGVIDLWACNAVRKRPDGASVYNPYNAKELAVELYNAGYMKADEVHKETAEKFVNETIKRKQTLMNPYTDDESECVSTFWIYKLAKQFGVEIKE